VVETFGGRAGIEGGRTVVPGLIEGTLTFVRERTRSAESR
jgi:hypothetical protein